MPLVVAEFHAAAKISPLSRKKNTELSRSRRGVDLPVMRRRLRVTRDDDVIVQGAVQFHPGFDCDRCAAPLGTPGQKKASGAGVEGSPRASRNKGGRGSGGREGLGGPKVRSFPASPGR